MPEPVTIQFTMSFSEVYAASWAIRRKAGLVRSWCLTIGGILVFLALANYVTYKDMDPPTAMSAQPETTVSSLSFMVVTTVVPIIVLLTMALVTHYVVAMTNYSSNKKLYTDISYRLDDHGIQRRTSETVTGLPWRQIWKMDESKQFILLYIGKHSAHAIPKRLFATKPEEQAFKAMLNALWDATISEK